MAISITVDLLPLNDFSQVTPRIEHRIEIDMRRTLIRRYRSSKEVTCTNFPDLGNVRVASDLDADLVVIRVLRTVITNTRVTVIPLVDRT